MASTRTIAVSVPNEVADLLDRQANKSAFVTAALQEKIQRDADNAIMDRLWGEGWRDNIPAEAMAEVERRHIAHFGQDDNARRAS
ncbi:hypothetical protein [Actinomadura sp. 6N118]|uniref:hypothetical protein n=1 Tax=Actinomadura sp. 6N118 TaxID=3375151 RepID=UPI00379B1427